MWGSLPSKENNNLGRFEKRRNHDRKPELYKCRCEWKKALELVALAFTSTKNKPALLGADGGQDKTSLPPPSAMFFHGGVFLWLSGGTGDGCHGQGLVLRFGEDLGGVRVLGGSVSGFLEEDCWGGCDLGLGKAGWGSCGSV